LKVEGFSGAAWGYNFDWQSRNFFAPRGTPTVVPTAFAARALIEAARQFKDDEYSNLARSVCDFLLCDLPRTVDTETEICFSYAPATDTRIFNASLLAAEVLAETGKLTNNRFAITPSARLVTSSINNNATAPGPTALNQTNRGSTASTLLTIFFH
jgi:hypothetical protein